MEKFLMWDAKRWEEEIYLINKENIYKKIYKNAKNEPRQKARS